MTRDIKTDIDEIKTDLLGDVLASSSSAFQDEPEQVIKWNQTSIVGFSGQTYFSDLNTKLDQEQLNWNKLLK